MMKKILCILLWVLSVQVADINAEEFNRIGQGIRNLGMGNVGIALAHDESALYYNPAGLGGIDEFFFSTNIMIEVSDDSIDLVSELQDVEDSSTSDTLEIALGKRLHLRLLANSNIIVPFDFFTFGFSALAEPKFNLVFENPVLPNMSFSFQYDTVFVAGLAVPVGKGGLVLGGGIRGIKRRGIFPAVTLSLDNLVTAGSESDSLLEQFSGAEKEAFGQAYDIGMHWRVPGEWSLTFGFAAQNIGGTTFGKGEREYPKDTLPEYSAGFSFQPGNEFIRLLYGFDIRDLAAEGTSDSDYVKRLHTGIELGILPIDSTSSFLAFRSGYNQGYFTYGIEWNPLIFSRLITFQVAVYGEETGEVAGGGKEARRLAQISFAF